MANYPPTPSYGVPYGEQNNNYMPSYNQQVDNVANQTPLSNPTYPPRQPPPNGPDAFAAYNMANAQFNANIPVFGSMPFPPAPFAPGTNMPQGAHAYQMPPAWNPPAGFPPNPMNWQQQPFNFAQNTPSQQYGLPRLDTNPQQQLNMPAHPAEEGELSEGEFEDGHQGRQKNIGDSSNNMREYAPHQSRRTDSHGYQYNNASPRETTYNDGNGNSAMPGGQRAAPSFSGRRQSANYSPFESPRQTSRPAPTESRRNRRKAKHGQNVESPRPAADLYRPAEQSRANMNNNSLPNRPPSRNRSTPAPDKSVNAAVDDLHEIPDDDRYSPQLERPATPDKRVLAQHAILNLMAAKVGYQDYIDEGIDETVVGGLFDSLGMPQSRPKPAQGVATPKAAESNGASSSVQAKPVAKPAAVQPSQPRNSSADLHNPKNKASILNGQSDAGKKEGPQSSTSSPIDSTFPQAGASTPTIANGEERKDKIARLLAEKQKKQGTAASPTADPVTPTAPSQAAAVKAEKDRLLNLKIENLRKSREARTLKNDAANKAPVAANANELKSALTSPISPLPTPQIPPQSPQVQPQQASQVQPASVPRVSPSSSSPLNVPSSFASPRPVFGGSLPPSVTLPPKPMVTPQSAPAIPGLFLSATVPSASATANVSIPPPSNGVQRKRPVAADFDEPTPSGAYKRPFGQSRIEKPLVIDVSEDESDGDDEGSAMDLDQPESGHDSAGPILDSSFSKSDMREKAPSVDRGIPQTTVQPNLSALSTQSSAKPSPDDLKSKLDQIAELHKKIAEAEAKKKAKASANRSGSQTPLAAEVANAQLKMVIAEKNEASAELERLLEGADEPIASTEQQTVEDSQAEKEATETRKRDVERKRKRRSEIQMGLPVVDAEVEKNQQRLEELRAEMDKAQAAIQKALEDKQKLESEMAKLGDEAEEQLQTEQTQQLTLAVRGTPSRIATPNQDSDPVQENSTSELRSSVIPPAVSQPLQNGTSHEKHHGSPEVMNPPTPQDVNMVDAVSPAQKQNGTSGKVIGQHAEKDSTPVVSDGEQQEGDQSVSTPAAVMENDEEAVVPGDGSQQIMDELPRAQSPISVSADQVLEAALQQASAQAEAESHTIQTPTEMAKSDVAELGEPPRAASSNLDAAGDGTRDLSSGEVSVQDPSIGGAVDGDSDAYEPQSNEIGGADDESETYEPREATPQPSHSSPFSPAPPEIASNVLEHSPVDASKMVSTNQETADSIEPLGSTSQNVAQISTAETRNDEHDASKRASFFTPYESPLKQFPSYRFNKNFSEEVAGGFRSLSYSHRIDPMKEFCRFELAGGACNDTNCEFQHFKDLNLADDMILLQLGDSETFNKQPDIKESFVTGLRSVLQDLKARKIRDFPTIAAEIAAFRAKFNAENMAL